MVRVRGVVLDALGLLGRREDEVVGRASSRWRLILLLLLLGRTLLLLLLLGRRYGRWSARAHPSQQILRCMELLGRRLLLLLLGLRRHLLHPGRKVSRGHPHGANGLRCGRTCRIDAKRGDGLLLLLLLWRLASAGELWR